MRRLPSGYTVATLMCVLGLAALFAAALWPQPDVPLATTQSTMDQFQHEADQSSTVIKDLAVGGIALFLPGLVLAVLVAFSRYRRDARALRPSSSEPVPIAPAPARAELVGADSARRSALPSADPYDDVPRNDPYGNASSDSYDDSYGDDSYGDSYGGGGGSAGSGTYGVETRQAPPGPLGTAVILDLRPTGTPVPDRPGIGSGPGVELELRLRVSAYDRRPSFETTLRMAASRFAPPQVGDVLRVRLDASRAERVTVLGM